MDPLTHGLFGAAAAKLSSKEKNIGLVFLCGFLGGMFPDIDILIRSSENPLLNIQYHRHFTHSLFFIPFGGLIVAAFLWPFLKSKFNFKSLWLYTSMGCAVHGVVDATTSYGTHLLWPFSNERTSWGTMTIIDPIVTFLLIGTLIVTKRRQSNKVLLIGLSFVALYFLFGVLQYYRAKEAMFTTAQERQHIISEFEVKPTLFNLILWRTLYIANDRIYIDSYRSSALSGKIKHYQGPDVPVFNLDLDLPNLPSDSILAQDIIKFTFFSAGFVAFKPDDRNVIGDMRYALLPNDTGPLWGIRINPEKPDQHVTFESFRQRKEDTLSQFWQQIKGE
jgi:inner membrane protein